MNYIRRKFQRSWYFCLTHCITCLASILFPIPFPVLCNMWLSFLNCRRFLSVANLVLFRSLSGHAGHLSNRPTLTDRPPQTHLPNHTEHYQTAKKGFYPEGEKNQKTTRSKHEFESSLLTSNFSLNALLITNKTKSFCTISGHYCGTPLEFSNKKMICISICSHTNATTHAPSPVILL